MAPDFLELGDVLHIHADQIKRYGGDAAIRDLGLLESDIAMPRATYGGDFLHRDIHEMAAAYMFHIAQNHPFADGNKRTAAAAALVFLEMNQITIEADEQDLYELVLDVAQGRADKARIADFLRTHS